jgi:hypothetical protein
MSKLATWHGGLRLAALLVCGAMASAPWHAVQAYYNANMSGVVSDFWAYADADHIYFRLQNQPTSHPGCNPSYFVIDGALPLERRKAMWQRLALAYALKEPVNVGYDNAGDCASTYLRVHRVG